MINNWNAVSFACFPFSSLNYNEHYWNIITMVKFHHNDEFQSQWWIFTAMMNFIIVLNFHTIQPLIVDNNEQNLIYNFEILREKRPQIVVHYNFAIILCSSLLKVSSHTSYIVRHVPKKRVPKVHQKEIMLPSFFLMVILLVV